MLCNSDHLQFVKYLYIKDKDAWQVTTFTNNFETNFPCNIYQKQYIINSVPIADSPCVFTFIVFTLFVLLQVSYYKMWTGGGNWPTWPMNPAALSSMNPDQGI